MSKDNMNDPKLDALDATRLLEDIFNEAEVEPNTVPIDALAAYSGYKKERFAPQKIILIAAIVILLLLPLLFISPKYTVTETGTNDEGLPVYTIDVSTVLPVKDVTASIGNMGIKVKETDSHTYTVSPFENGEMNVSVSLFNSQVTAKTVTVTSVDETAPDVKGSSAEDGNLVIMASDSDSGLDLESVYAEDADGNLIEPKKVSDDGEIEFESPETGWNIYISDKTGNTLHLKLSKK